MRLEHQKKLNHLTNSCEGIRSDVSNVSTRWSAGHLVIYWSCLLITWSRVWVWYFWVFLDVIGLESINWAFYWGDREPWGTFGLRSGMTLILRHSMAITTPIHGDTINHPQKQKDRDLEVSGLLSKSQIFRNKKMVRKKVVEFSRAHGDMISHPQ